MRVSRAAILLLVATVAGADAVKVSAEELMRWLDQAEPPLLLDIRGREAYLSGTLPGALDAGSNPAGYLPDNRGGEVVLITGVPPPRNLAGWTRRLERVGHRVHVLAGGLAAWRAAGGEVVDPEESFTRPGSVPFVIPRGLCEMNEPAQVYR